MTLLLPHIERSLQLRERLEAAEAGAGLAFDLLERLAVGVVLVDAAGRVLFASRKAARLLSAGDALMVKRGALAASDARDAVSLGNAIAQAAATGAGAGLSEGTFLRISRVSGPALPVLAAPIRSKAPGLNPTRLACAIVFSGPEANTTVGEDALARRWDLTPAQARLLAALTTGAGLAGYAAAARVGIGTVRTHLKELFAKVGCHRQADLIRIALSDPVLRLADGEGFKDMGSRS